MHPILVSRTRLGLYLLAWLPFAAAQAYFLNRFAAMGWSQSSFTSIGLTIFFAIVCLSPWYSCQYLPFTAEGMAKLLVNHIAAAVTAAAIYIGAGALAGVRSTVLLFLYSSALLLYILAVALHYVLFSLESSREAEAREQEARVLARDAELKALKAQINPHFLFNSLNSISALATIDGQRARDMCLRLSEFLRSTLSLAEKDMVPLTQEMALAKTYLEVERVRFGDRLRVEQTLEGTCNGCSVPSLILQPLVENAVKHGIAGMVDGGEIALHAHCENGVLHLSISNDFDSDASPPEKSGLGLANVRGRLRARYQNRARMFAEVRHNRYCVDLELPCDQ